MTVPLGKRTESKVEFLHLMGKIQRNITLLLIKDFGIKPVQRQLKTFTYNAKMSQEDRDVFMDICGKYHIDVEAEWPLWLVDHYRNKILRLLDSMEEHIVTANTIYPTASEYEYWHNLRRKYQKFAQADCYKLLRAMQDICFILPVDKEKLMPYVELISDEMEAIKAWQKRTGNQYRQHLSRNNK